MKKFISKPRSYETIFEAKATLLPHKIITRRPNGSIRVQTRNEEPSMTDASHGEDADINVIMNRFMKTGQLPNIKIRQAQYADVSEMTDLLEQQIRVREAQAAFDSLPATLRSRLNGDPNEFIKFLNNDENYEEAVELGLIDPSKTRRPKVVSKPAAGEKRPSAKYAPKSGPSNDDDSNDDE